MNIKALLKRSAPLNSVNAWMKSHLQEGQATTSLAFYRTEAAKRGLSLPQGDELVVALHQRLAVRRLHPVPKRKGYLHIFLTYPLSNWESVIPLALAPFGRVTVFEWRSLGFDDSSDNWLKQRKDMNMEMLEIFRKAHTEQPVDAVVGYLSGYNTDSETLIKMANSGSVIFNFSWDDKLYFLESAGDGLYRGPGALASVVDLNLTNAPDSCIKYFVEGGLAMFWPEAAHPDIHKPYDVPYEFDVSFVGGRYGWRPKFIAELQKMGIKVSTFGNGWENGPLSDEEMVKLYSRSRINLGFAGVGHSKKLMCLKGRDFEVPMSGGLYLTQDNPELSLVYEVGKEILTYRNEVDCAQKIKWLIENQDEADKIRKRGRERAIRDHTWEERFENIFRLAGFLV